MGRGVIVAPDEIQWVDGAEMLLDEDYAADYEDSRELTSLIRKLTTLRKGRSMTQGDVATAMCTGQSTISAFENGEHDPYFSTVQRYARALGLRLIPDLVQRMPYGITAHDIASQPYAPFVDIGTKIENLFPGHWGESIGFGSWRSEVVHTAQVRFITFNSRLRDHSDDVEGAPVDQ
jgi:transcriptional regulator with XRE-family HTH domain